MTQKKQLKRDEPFMNWQPATRIVYVVMCCYGKFECVESKFDTYIEALARMVELRRAYGGRRKYRVTIL